MACKDRYKFESKIHIYRATKRMIQQELADLAEVSRQTIMQLERNRYNPSMLLAYSITKVFNMAIEDLFNIKALFIAGAWIGLPLSVILLFIFIQKIYTKKIETSEDGKLSEKQVSYLSFSL